MFHPWLKLPLECESQAAPACVSRRAGWLFGLFRRHGKRYVARHFHAVRLSRGGPVPAVLEGPLIVVLNHPSWWDPMIGLVVSELWPGRNHFAPIESKALARYRFFERLGFFGVEPGTSRGARAFLRDCLAIASVPGAMIWITAQGRFTDPRERPVVLRKGVGHVARKLSGGSVLPMALEYPFWNERGPEALVRFGRPLPIGEASLRSAEEWTGLIARELENVQDALAAEAIDRDPSAFEILLEGAAGVGGVYDFWRRFRAALRGERFRPEHEPRSAPSPRNDR